MLFGAEVAGKTDPEFPIAHEVVQVVQLHGAFGPHLGFVGASSKGFRRVRAGLIESLAGEVEISICRS